MATTPNYGWVTPAPTDFVTDLPADFETFADAVDADLGGLLGGTTGQYLTKDSDDDHDFSWTTLTSGGETLLASGTLSGGTVVLSAISQSYKNLKLVVRNFKPATDDASFSIRFNGDDTSSRHGGPTYSNGAFDNETFASTFVKCGFGNDNSVATGLTVIQIPDYTNSTTWKMVKGWFLEVDGTTTTRRNATSFIGAYNQIDAVTSLTLLSSSGNMTSGNYYLYGVN